VLHLVKQHREKLDRKQTLINLDFIKWLHDEYEMSLDIYGLISQEKLFSCIKMGNDAQQKTHLKYQYSIYKVEYSGNLLKRFQIRSVVPDHH